MKKLKNKKILFIVIPLFVILCYIADKTGLLGYLEKTNNYSLEEIEIPKEIEEPEEKEENQVEIEVENDVITKPTIVANDKTKTNLIMLDTKDGQSILIDCGEKEVLVDGGLLAYMGDKNLSILKSYIDGPLEYVIISHFDKDHIAGLENIYYSFTVETTIYGDLNPNNTLIGQKIESIMKKKSRKYYEDKNEIISLSQNTKIQILDILDNQKESNNDSVVLMLDVAGKKALIAGDLEDNSYNSYNKARTIKNLLLPRLEEVSVYIVSHHGSNSSSSYELLNTIKPKICLISAAGPESKYNNPDFETVVRLKKYTTKIFGTFFSGNIKIEMNTLKITSLSKLPLKRITQGY